MLDLALPHDTDPAIAELPGVHRLDLVTLSTLPATAASEDDVAGARSIIEHEVAAYVADLAAQQVEPTLISLRAHAGSVLDAEMARLRLRLAGVDPRRWPRWSARCAGPWPPCCTTRRCG